MYSSFLAFDSSNGNFIDRKQQDVLLHMINVADRTSFFSKLPAKTFQSICRSAVSCCQFFFNKNFQETGCCIETLFDEITQKLQFGWTIHDIET